ncbi:M20/M25/M40 family metallo-hydrolase [Sphingosinicella rhizophila]|uniref:M20/M25/M40 family metallo-hydrolase n=1 Tax=Sphingosinicella rhizophila TaxID=3050082 RepID=A0ABU3QA80_9SPHN|nr:M20/M25/M40 family metallo-hydrolase [Sphingosinicella sp. GR2756]MDT9600321.1 M20/M25/M40 family metallo-hydrolase [Sphingosinicella sp. GR2756]
MIRARWASLLLLLPTVPASAQVMPWIEANRARILADYVELLTIPNVAGDIPNIRRNADHIVGMMRARGLSPRLLETGDPSAAPAVYGEWLVPGATRTLVLYAHYDGQPVAPEDWKSGPPFTPVLRSERMDKGGEVLELPSESAAIRPEWRLYARSASDDKAGVMAIIAAVDALKAAGKRPSFNLKIFLEGEEEAGSPNLAAMLAKHRELLRSDGWVIFDGPDHPSGAGQVVLGVRGVVGVDLAIYGPVRPLHSGHYGNWAPNPAMMLSRLLASMKDEKGRVAVAGFYDDVVPLTDRERKAVEAVPSVDDRLREDLGLAATEGDGRSLAALIQEPSLNVGGIRSADVGESGRNVIPTIAEARLDLRLVMGNDHVRQVQKLVRHIEGQGYKVLDRAPTMAERRQWPMIATVKAGSGYNAERTSLDAPLATSVIAATRDHGATVILPTMGGSLPLFVLRETLAVPSVGLALANHDNNQHAEDENLRLGHLWRAIDVAAAVMTMR